MNLYPGEKRSPWLLSVELDIQNSENCDKIYRGEKMKNGFNDSTMICAGYAPGGKDSCQVSFIFLLFMMKNAL